MSILGRNSYRPRFPGYFTLRALVILADGLLSLIFSPFHIDCHLYSDFCYWNLKKDSTRMGKAK